tara:strand:+ start:2296 stop:2586 length:291 start_codon:yes stop_codon:yes gene_type:complete
MSVAELTPCNRFVLLSAVPESESEQQTTVLVPDSYKVKSSLYGVYQLEQVSTDCTVVNEDDLGKLLLVNDSMVETASLEQGDFLLVQENHIFGVMN